MNTTEETGTAPATAEVAQPKPPKRPNVGKRSGNVAPARKKAGKKATSPRKPPTARRKAKVAKPVARDGSKTAKILAVLGRPGGASVTELLKATGWQPHSVRGFLSATVGKKMGLKVASAKGKDGERRYSVKG